MKKQIFANSLIYFICIFAACLANLLITSMTLKIVNLFIVVDFFTAAIIRSIVALVVIAGVLGLVIFFESYKSESFYVGHTSASIALSGVYHLALSTVLMFYPFIAGGTRYLAGLINMGEHFDSSACVKEIYLWAYLTAFGIYFVLELATAIICGYAGKHARLKNRQKLMGAD